MAPITTPGQNFVIDGVVGNFTVNTYEVGDIGNDTYIRVEKNEVTGTATTNFTNADNGPDGEYTVTLGYYDGSTGDGAIALEIGGTAIGTINLTENDDQARTQVFNNVTIGDGDEIKITGTRQGGDGARVDFIQFELLPPADNEAPTADTFAPADNATDVAIGDNLTVTFNETIQAGTGNIVIKNAADNSVVETIPVGDATIAGTTLTINPTADLAAGTGYYVEIAAGAVTDLAGNDFAGIADATTWNFNTAGAPDTEVPTVATFTPADDATDAAVGANLVVTFSEAIQAGTGNIVIKNAADDSVVETIPVGDATIAGATLTIDPSADLTAATDYYVEIAAGAVTDLAGNDFAGIADATTWNFTTAAAPDTEVPTAATFTPADNATNAAVGANLSVTFSEAIQAGTGNIVIKNAADDSVVETIPVGDATIAGTTLTINPTANLAAETGYYVEIAAGAVTDLAGNDFAGIADATTWNFTTAADSGTGGGTDSGTGGGTDSGTGGGTDGGTGGSTDGGTGDDTVGDTGGSTGGDTGSSTGGDTGSSTGGSTGSSTGSSTGGSTSSSTGGTTDTDSSSTGGSTGSSTDSGTGGGTDTNATEVSIELQFPEFPDPPTTDNTVPGDDADNALSGGETGDSIDGGAGNDAIDGGGGDDNLAGGVGNDVINGGSGNDVINGGSGNDVVFAGLGDDGIDGGEGVDVIAAGAGNDIINGGNGNDIMFGNDGTDFIEGGAGSDLAFGGKGSDVMDGGEGDDALVGNLGNDSITGGAGNDVAFGNVGDDLLSGGPGDDMLYGGKGNDTLIGGAGNDILAGNLGDDLLTGGLGGDRFDFSSNDGVNIITDFQDGVDIIGLEEGFTFSDLTVTQINADTQIQAGGTSITLQGIDASLISEADIAFIL